MPYLVLAMELLAVTWFVLMAIHLTDLQRWSKTVPRPRLDAIGAAIQASAKWAFPTGLLALLILSLIEISRITGN